MEMLKYEIGLARHCEPIIVKGTNWFVNGEDGDLEVFGEDEEETVCLVRSGDWIYVRNAE